jgi:hypothetical protein
MAASAVAPASATSLVRASLDDLVAANGAVVLGEVLDAYSYWNAEGTFILTDVRFRVDNALKGNLQDRELTVTLMGGTVGETTTLIIGGAELIPGNSYVLFLNEEDLPGAKGVRTVRDLAQGAFDVVMSGRGLRAISQANQHPLIPDKSGYFDAAGGPEGYPLTSMMQSVREIAGREGRRPEVQ